MANYAHIEITEGVSIQTAANLFRDAVRKCFGKKLAIHKAAFRDTGPTWAIQAVGSALKNPEANKMLVAQGQDLGFVVSLSNRVKINYYQHIDFRRPLNRWESWAQGLFLEEVSCRVKKPYTLDAIGKSFVPGTRLFGTNYREWAESLDQDPQAYKRHAPKGFW